MDIYWLIWYTFDPYGSIWTNLDLLGHKCHIWTHLVPFGKVWTNLDQFWHILSCLDQFERILTYLVLFGAIWSLSQKKSKWKLFPKGGRGLTPKFTFLKSPYTVKKYSKLIYLTQEYVLVSSESNRKSFLTPTFSLKFLSKNLYFEGGWGRGSMQFGKSLQ